MTAILVNPPISAEQLFAFYQRNNICETGFGQQAAAKVLAGSSLIVAAFAGEELIAIARAMFDGLSAAVMEISVDPRYQGDGGKYANGSLLEKDQSGLCRQLGQRLIQELLAMGATFISAYIVENAEEEVYASMGFKLNGGHLVYHLDRRLYVNRT